MDKALRHGLAVSQALWLQQEHTRGVIFGEGIRRLTRPLELHPLLRLMFEKIPRILYTFCHAVSIWAQSSRQASSQRAIHVFAMYIRLGVSIFFRGSATLFIHVYRQHACLRRGIRRTPWDIRGLFLGCSLVNTIRHVNAIVESRNGTSLSHCVS